MFVQGTLVGPHTPAKQCVGGQTVSAAQTREITQTFKTEFRGTPKFQNWLTGKFHVCEKGTFGATQTCNTMCGGQAMSTTLN
jgi:hypothetical protein